MNTLRKLICLLTLSVPVTAFAEEAAGIVLVAAGEVTASAANEAARPLRRRSEFFSGEVLRVGENGKAQVRFRDGSLVSLRAGTEIRIDEFHFDAHDRDGRNRNFFTLLKGGFRTITGTVGKQRPEAHQVNTAVATIGVRGTTYSVVLADELYVGVWQGGVTVTNAQGSLNLGANAAYNFARVSGSDHVPQGLIAPPPVLLNTVSLHAAPAELAQTSPAAAEQKDRPAGTEQPPPPTAAAASQHEATRQASAIDTPAPEAGRASPPGPAPLAPSLGRLVLPVTQSSPAAGALIFPQADLLAQPVNTDLDRDGIPDVFTAPGDARLPASETAALDRLGVAVPAAAAPAYAPFLGRASDGSSGAPLLVDPGLPADDARFTTATPAKVVRRHAAPLIPGTLGTHGAYAASWGVWDASPATPAIAQTSALDARQRTDITQPVYWLTAAPTPPATLGALGGSRVYNHVLAHLGESDNGKVNKIGMKLDLNLATGAAGGVLGVDTAGGDYWEVKLGGQMRGASLDLAALPGSRVYQGPNVLDGVTGQVDGIITGAFADALGGYFELRGATLPLRAQGVFLADRDRRLAVAEWNSLDRLGLAVLGGVGAVGFYGGRAGAGLADPLFVDNGLPPFDPHFNTTPALNVLRKGTAPLFGTVAHPTYAVSWGAWGATGGTPAWLMNDPASAAVMSPVTDTVFWITALPTDPVTLATLTGTASYRNVLGFQGGSSSGGSIAAMYINTRLDFGSGRAAGSLYVHTGSDYWDMDFTGSLAQGVLDLAVTTPGSVLVSGANGTQMANGSIKAILTGTGGEAIAGIFDFQTTSGPLADVDGTFLADDTNVGDLRIAPAERASLDRAGFAVVNDSTIHTPLANAPLHAAASDGAGGGPLLVDKTIDGFTGYAEHVLRRGTSALTGPGGNPSWVRTDNGQTVVLPVSWGTWNQPGNDAVLDYRNPDDPLLAAAIRVPAHWVTVQPTASATMAGLSGLVSYNNPHAFFGSTTNGDITSPSASIGVDFTSGGVSGNFGFGTAVGDSWNVNFSGVLSGPALKITTVGGNLNGVTPIDGKVAGYLTGPRAEGVAGAFDLQKVADPTVHAQGVFVLGCGTVCP